MKCVPNFTSKNITLRLDSYKQIQPVAHALSTELRLKILQLISHQGMSVNEIAQALDVPVSTAALNVQVLEQAGLITCNTQPGVRGTMKICDRRIDNIHIRLIPQEAKAACERMYDMPVGCYSTVGDIAPTCGLASWESSFDMDDDPSAFYHPLHFSADLIWLREGYVEYNFPAVDIEEASIDFLEFSFEACAEAPCYRNDWPSDLYVQVNGVEIGIWHCPGDFGGRRGQMNPTWWHDTNTQYGHLKTWRINRRGTQLESAHISAVSLADLRLKEHDHTTLRIGVKKTDGHAGGMNLFGRRFGDYPQDIRMRYVGRI